MINLTVTGQQELSDKLTKLAASRGGLDRILEVFAQKIFDSILAGAAPHSKTGNLVRSLGSGPERIGNGYQIKHDLQLAEYAKYLNWGHRAFDIVPRDKKALRWVNGSGFIFAKVVHIPESKGDPYFHDGISNVVRDFDAIVKANWNPLGD